MSELELLKEIIEFHNNDGTYWLMCKWIGKRAGLTEDQVDEMIGELIK